MVETDNVILHIRRAVMEDVPVIRGICDVGIGPGYYTDEFLRGIIEAPEEDIYVSATNEDEVAGFLYIFMSSLGEAMERMCIPDSEPAFDGMDRSLRVGVYKTAATGPEFKNNSICHDLVVYTEAVMESKGASMILAPGLEDPSGKCFVRGLLEATGSREVARVMKPWSRIDCYCPHCRERFCICDSLIFLKDVRG